MLEKISPYPDVPTQLPERSPAGGFPLTSSRFRWLYSDLFALVLIVAVNLLCFGNSLGGYFFSDDFSHIVFLHKMFQAHPEMVLLNLNAPWHTDQNQFLRPFVELSLALDFLLWKANALGYHITNLVLQIITSVSVFAITKATLTEVDRKQASIAALFSGVIFASYPLHSEVVSWPTARVDGLCGAFYLLSLWLFLKSNQVRTRLSLIGSLCCFVIALLSKEMAVSLPVVTAIYLFLCDGRSGQSLKQRLATALRRTTPYWLTLFGYLALRAALLGTVIGGYGTSFGEILYASFLPRIIDAGPFWRLLYPINTEVVPLHGKLASALHYLYMLTGMSILLRSIWLPWPSWLTRKISFFASFLLIGFTPTFQVWNLFPDLSGSRYAYIPSAPLCILLTLLVFPFSQSGASARTRPSYGLQRVSLGLLALFVCLFSIITCRNNEAWLHASKALIAIRDGIVNEVSQHADRRRVVVINPPRLLQGAQMCYKFEILQELLQPPFLDVDFSGAVGSLQPKYLNKPDLLNMSRLREMSESGNYKFCLWNSKSGRLQFISPEQQATWFAEIHDEDPMIKSLKQDNIRENGSDYKRFTFSIQRSTSAPRFEFLIVTAVTPEIGTSTNRTTSRPRMSVSWSPSRSELFGTTAPLSCPLFADGQPHSYLFAPGELGSWSLAERIDRLTVCFPKNSHDSHILSIRLLPRETLVPNLLVDRTTCQEQPSGLHTIKSDAARFNYDASNVPQASAVIVEISKCYNEFDHFSASYRDWKPSSHALASLHFKNVSSCFPVPLELLPSAGWYQVRLAAVDSDSRVVGFFCDPVYLKVSERQIDHARRAARERPLSNRAA